MSKIELRNSYVYKKEVDWSLLNQGLSIPLDIQVVFQNNIKEFIQRGESKEIFLYLEGVSYKVKLVNQKFDEVKFQGHKDILQIRYSPNSPIVDKFRSIFSRTWIKLSEKRNQHQIKQRVYKKISEGEREYLALYTTEYEDTFLVECITFSDNAEARNIFVKEDEQNYETSVNYPLFDPTASICETQQLAKIRKLNIAIGNNLKLLYNFQCQICGEDFGRKFDTHIAESHHIDPFVVSMNNDASNQVIICPNHHRVIHKAKAVFDRSRLLFVYSNGVEEKLILNSHLA